MSLEVGGGQWTDAVIETLDALQNQAGLAQLYVETLDALIRSTILNISGEEADDSAVLSRIRTLKLIRRDIIALAMPAGVDDTANDKLIISF